MSTAFSGTPSFTFAAPARSGRVRQTNSWRAALSRVIALWVARSSQRKALADLTEERHLLDDIGLTRAQALREAAKPFWRR